MEVAVDSNILVFLADPRSLFHDDSAAATSRLSKGGDSLVVFPQNLIEFWAVATRPVLSNGLGFTAAQVVAEIAQIRSIFRLIPETSQIYPEWQRLVTAHNVAGKNVHDTRIAAQMLVHGIESILTFNTKDFKRFANITALDPSDIR
ncbi:hypothetical protein BH10ACI3_BH10ACI3_27550 [soil metagenome]